MEINRIRPDEHTFTQRLAGIADAPKSLCYMGVLPAERTPVVAIVGTRKPTSYGREVTQRLAYDLAKQGVIIVSGLALGVDGIAHRAALEAGGRTVGVVIDELPQISPRSHIRLAHTMIKQGGAILSEWGRGDGAPMAKWAFLRRNRLVSGLADAVIITEAAARSGTLNTAAHALNQGREVLVVPGNITSPLSEGCNALLKQGASPITYANDVLDIIAPQLRQQSAQQTLPIGTTPAETDIIRLLAAGVRSGDELQKRAKLAAADFATALTMLEINGMIQSLGANQWRLK
ncbi:MAG: DNA-processing protein DprA [Candidatus Saccharibacteria bacterium]|nr:DNA-processing protein DprA [Candidatus Saccharibacteria bacterium]